MKMSKATYEKLERTSKELLRSMAYTFADAVCEIKSLGAYVDSPERAARWAIFHKAIAVDRSIRDEIRAAQLLDTHIYTALKTIFPDPRPELGKAYKPLFDNLKEVVASI